jgi:membrane-associated phospholipid phosphatase
MKTIEIQSTDDLQAQRAVKWGILLSLIGLLLFTMTTYSLLTSSFLYLYDQPLEQLFVKYYQASPAWLILVANILTSIGSIGTGILAFVMLGWLAFHKRWHEAGLLFVSAAIGEVIWWLSIHYFNRPRPTKLVTAGVNLPSYPSGHTLIIFTIIFLLLYLYTSHIQSPAERLALYLLAIFWGLLTGLIRMYLNYHYFTDILAGYGLGMLWLGFTILIMDAIFLKKDKIQAM